MVKNGAVEYDLTQPAAFMALRGEAAKGKQATGFFRR